MQTRNDAKEITDLSFEKGGVVAGYHQKRMIAVLGYFRGEPAQDFANKDVGFIYVTALAKQYRLSRTFRNGMDFTFRRLHEMGVKEIRCHASVHDPYTNKIYSHFANRLGEETTLRGRQAILYGNSIENILAYLDKNGPAKRATVQPSGALWHCSPCNVWWLSKAAASPETWHLERMPAVAFSNLDEAAQQQLKAPAWNISGPSPLFCPECGQAMRSSNEEAAS